MYTLAQYGLSRAGWRLVHQNLSAWWVLRAGPRPGHRHGGGDSSGPLRMDKGSGVSMDWLAARCLPSSGSALSRTVWPQCGGTRIRFVCV